MTDEHVELHAVEQLIVANLAACRQYVNAARGIRNQRRNTDTDDGAHLLGLAGEFAFCKLKNIYPDLSIGPRRGTPDCRYVGKTVDVKTRPAHPLAQLLALPHKVGEADCYALMLATNWPARFTFQFRGFVSAAALFTAANLTDLGHGPTYAYDQQRLHNDIRVIDGDT